MCIICICLFLISSLQSFNLNMSFDMSMLRHMSAVIHS